MIIVALVILIVAILLINNKPKKVTPQPKKTNEIERIKRRIDAEYSYFNNLSSKDFKNIDISGQMLLTKENELNLQIRRAKV